MKYFSRYVAFFFAFLAAMYALTIDAHRQIAECMQWIQKSLCVCIWAILLSHTALSPRCQNVRRSIVDYIITPLSSSLLLLLPLYWFFSTARERGVNKFRPAHWRILTTHRVCVCEFLYLSLFFPHWTHFLILQIKHYNITYVLCTKM